MTRKPVLCLGIRLLIIRRGRMRVFQVQVDGLLEGGVTALVAAHGPFSEFAIFGSEGLREWASGGMEVQHCVGICRKKNDEEIARGI
jgi:hypothetical protein